MYVFRAQNLNNYNLKLTVTRPRLEITKNLIRQVIHTGLIKYSGVRWPYKQGLANRFILSYSRTLSYQWLKHFYIKKISSLMSYRTLLVGHGGQCQECKPMVPTVLGRGTSSQTIPTSLLQRPAVYPDPSPTSSGALFPALTAADFRPPKATLRQPCSSPSTSVHGLQNYKSQQPPRKVRPVPTSA